jgi:NadR type nicotinamide-nucleotide adenylyltransferase
MIRICFHGAESTGKSVLAEKLSRELGLPWVPEYGREYAETHGADFSMADLLAIAAGHEARVKAVEATGAAMALLDTDPLMTAAWAEMLFGEVPGELLSYPKADLYLLFEADVPWIEDGTRFFGSQAERARFAATAEAMLQRAGVTYLTIGGDWAGREGRARAAIAGLT